MLWIILTFVVALIFTIVNILDKHVITHELRNPYVCTVVNGFIAFILYIILTLIWGSFNIIFSLNLKDILLLVAGGIALGGAVFFYYQSMKAEEASRVMSLLNLDRIFIFIMATIFLHEVFNLTKYVGIGLLIVGAVVISIKPIKNKTKMIPVTTIMIILISAFLWALRTVLVRAASLEVSFLNMMFWIGLGQLVVALILFLFFVKEYKRYKKGIEFVAGITLIDVIGMALFFLALAIAPAAILVSALASVHPLFVFLLAFLVTKLKPSITKEELSPRTLILKIIAIAMIVVGVILIMI